MADQIKTRIPGWPEAQGLFNPSLEKDACGVGFVCHMKGKRSHQIIQDALAIDLALSHRGACGCEPNTGDGAGMFLQIPDKFFRKVCKEEGFELPEEGQYGAGILSFTQDEAERKKHEKMFEDIVAEEGQEFLGWRTVPVDSSVLGETSASCEPFMRQAFIKRSADIKTALDFERKLYVIRRVAKHRIQSLGDADSEFFYIATLSARTMVYKGMLTPEQLATYFPDFHDPDMESALALVHSRFSTNTFPSWPRAHPYRYMSHNGEINTLRGNVNWMKARQACIDSKAFNKEDYAKILPICREDGSDSAMFDNTLEFLVLSGRELPHAVMMMIPEPWENHESMAEDRRAFYEYHATMMEPWDGPASIAFTDGKNIGAILDRNGLRPSRYYVTSDDRVIMASEVGVVPGVEPSMVIKKGRLEPGRMFLVNMEEGRIVADQELKQKYIQENPYGEWLDKNRLFIDKLPEPTGVHGVDHETVLHRQKAFGYTYEDLRFILAPMAQNGVEPIGSMGNDAPLAVLSNKSKLLYNYFKQLFAQVTNPPLDSIREALITGSITFLGSEGDITNPKPESCRMLRLENPVLNNHELAQIRQMNEAGLKTATIDIVFDADGGGKALEAALEDLFKQADDLVKSGVNILLLSDRAVDENKAGIPALLATAALHHHLIREGLRTKTSLVLESGEPREVHHFATLVGFGADAINPYLAFESIYDLVHEGILKEDYEICVKKYIKASIKGIIKTMSKMGISTVASYRGAQIFECIGLKQEVIDRYFTWTASRIEGIGLEEIAKEVRLRHRKAFPEGGNGGEHALDAGGLYQWRHDGEYHLWSPHTVHTLQSATRRDDYETFKKYSGMINEQTKNMATLRGLMEFDIDESKSIPIEEVEPIEEIMKRFKTGAMSYGSISREAHEALAIAMNRVGGKSNTGEGGEDPDRFTPDANGDSRCSAIKQVASGRFGVTSQYMVNSKELQIKIAQGAKPGEGGQLPGLKVFPEIAKVRGTTAGVGLISPPPHHDIYSIEDLSQLIHDLKNANHYARVNVKLVAEIGVGTIAAGVAKGHADVILISGYDGGTGASPLSSIQHAGGPWELGVAETNQILLLNNLRSRVVLEADGQMKTGRDIVIAALLGAEEFGMSTAPLVTLGCLMMRVCHKNTCPVGVATQNPELRKKFMGDPEYAVRFMKFMAQEIREYMALLGFRTLPEMVGRVDRLKTRPAIDHWKAKGLDFSKIFYRPPVGPEVGTYCQMEQDHELDKALDNTHLLAAAKATLEDKTVKSYGEFPIVNINRVVGTIVGSEVTRRHGPDALEEDTINFKFNGSAGQSLGAFCPKGMTLTVEGDANDFFGKCVSGAKLIIYPPKDSHKDFVPSENIIVGNVCFYGATSGESYIAGVAGERFCVRNSGVHAVVEGVGDHGCEYMTGGSVTILGHTGRNFGAGMSGGIAYILDEKDEFAAKLNAEMVNLFKLIECDDEEIAAVKARIERHVQYTGSAKGQYVLDNWDKLLPKFQKVLPKDYERMLNHIKKARETGLSGDDAIKAAFEANANDVSRVSGN